MILKVEEANHMIGNWDELRMSCQGLRPLSGVVRLVPSRVLGCPV